MNKTFSLIVFLFLSIASFSQTQITWEDLEDVTFTRKYSKEVDAYFLFPTFGPKVKALNNKVLSLKGYIIVIDPQEKFYVLSRYPNSTCFFCGAADPNTIVELDMKSSDVTFKMDQVVTIKGRFKLNGIIGYFGISFLF